MLPKLLDISNEKCRGTLRRLELETYSNVISVFRAQGNLTEQKTKILNELRKIFSIQNDRHRAEIRRANSDELLCTISEKLFGNASQIEWLKEGRRSFPLLPRGHPLTALSHIATQMSRQAYRENVKLAREEALQKIKLAAIERVTAERAAAELEISKISCTIVSGEQIKQNDNEKYLSNNHVKIEKMDEIKNNLEISKNEEVELTKEDMAKVNYLELKELLKLSTTVNTKSSTAIKTTKNHNINKKNNSRNIVKRKLKTKKLNILKTDKSKLNNQKEINVNNNDNENNLENKQQKNKLHKKRKRRITRKKKLSETNQLKIIKKINNKEKINKDSNDSNSNKTDASCNIINIPPIINYDKINQMPVQKCILNIDLKSTTPVTPPIAILNEQQQNYVTRTIDLKRPSNQPIQTVLEPKRLNISDAKILKIDNFNQTQQQSQSKTNVICLNQLQKIDNSDTFNHNIPVNIQKINPIIMNNIKLNTANLKSSGIQQRKRVNLMTSSTGKVFIRPIDEKNSSILSLASTVPIATTSTNSLNQISPNCNINLSKTTTTTTATKLNIPTVNLTTVSLLDNKAFQQQQQTNQIKGNQTIDFYSTPTGNTLNKNYQVIQLSPKKNLNLDKTILNSTNNIFVIGSIPSDLKNKYDKLQTIDIKNKPLIKIDNKINNVDLITEDTPVDIVNENLLQYNDTIIVEQNNRNDHKITNTLTNKNNVNIVNINNKNNNIHKNNNNNNNSNNISNNNDSNNNGNSNNNEEIFYKNYGESSTGSMIIETEKNLYNNCIDNIKTKQSEKITRKTEKTETPQCNEVDWELELDQQAQKTNNEIFISNNNGIINNYSNNCIIYKNINKNEKTSSNFNDYIEEIVEESISDEESGNTINNGYYNFQEEEEEECIVVDDSTIK